MRFDIKKMSKDFEMQDDEMLPVLADIDEGGDDMFFSIGDDGEMPILALRNMVLFPGVILPVTVGREKSLSLIKKAEKNKEYIGVVAQKIPETDDPKLEDLHSVGTVAQVIRILEMPDGRTTAIIQGRRRFSLNKIIKESPYLIGDVKLMEEESSPDMKKKEKEALFSAIKDAMIRILKDSVDSKDESIFAIKNIKHPIFFINFISTHLVSSFHHKQELLEILSLRLRSFKLLEILNQELEIIMIKARIQNKTSQSLDQQQKEYVLQQQLKAIQTELGGNSNEEVLEELEQKAQKLKVSSKIKKVLLKEIEKLRRIHSQSPDFSIQLSYVENVINLPWNVYTKDNFNLKTAERRLNKDHYGLEKVKERILEHLAVLKLKGDMKSPIICLYGPPGVGKTSLGKSVAEALKRKYIRISLGGLHDEAEVRGHRRTYIGAMPGRIIQGLQKAESANPVFILDEIDKVGTDYKGDPSSALLEVLDPEQNNTFHDNYVDLDFDLSKVLFIATANTLNTISHPLLDRMELIEVNGYIIEEKIEIARKHIIPKELENHGLPIKKIQFPKKTLEVIIDGYTRESGVRSLEKQIAKVCRKIAKNLAMEDKVEPEKILKLSVKDITEMLGKPIFSKDLYQGNEYAGVVTGLAWTSVGGEILFIESSLHKSKGSKLTLTGNLGDVMKESAIIALEYVKTHAEELGISMEQIDGNSVHIHVPEGAVPKDGPSAGVTMVTSLVSAFKKKKILKSLAMTGEITLRGKVLPIGGVKEKILAAKRSGITQLVLPKDNERDITEIDEIYLKGLNFHYVSDIKDVLAIAITDEDATK